MSALIMTMISGIQSSMASRGFFDSGAMPPPIHIATLNDVNAQTGQGLRLHHLITHIASVRMVSLLAPTPVELNALRGQLIQTLLHDDTDIAHFNRRPFSLDNMFQFGLLFGQLRRFLKKAHAVYTDQPLILWCARYGARQAIRVIEVNGIYCEEWITKGRLRNRQDVRFRIMRAIEARGLRMAHAVIVVSPGLRDYVIHELRVDPGRVHVIPNGIDLAMLNSTTDTRAARVQLGLTDEPVALFVGSFRPWHGVQNLIHALPVALERLPALKLVLVGDGPTRENCETLVNELGLRASVIFTGHQPAASVPEFIAAADACVYYPNYTVDHYGFMGDPIKLREYMAMGKPVVTVKLPNFAEVIERECCGMVVAADHRRFGEALATILSDPERGMQLGRNGRKAVEQQYDWKTIVQRILAVFDESVTCLNSTGRP